MSEENHLLAIHISETSSMHAFAEVITMVDGQKTDSVLTRFKDRGFVDKEAPHSAASQTVIYAPITEDAAQAFKDFSWLMMQLSLTPNTPVLYKSAFEPMPEIGFDMSGNRASDGKTLSDPYKEKIYANCVDMLMLSCAVAGIDLKSIIALPDGQSITNQSQNLKSAVSQSSSVNLGETRDFKITAPRDVAEPLVFAVSKNNLTGPTDAFNSISAYPNALMRLDDPYAFYAEQAPLPAAISIAAGQNGVVIPRSLAVKTPA